MKYKPHMAALAAGVGLMAFASPAAAFSGDEAIMDGSNFRLNPDTLEPGCFVGARMASTHVDLEYLAEGDYVKELHIWVKKDAPFSVDQVLVPSKRDGYAVYDSAFDTGTTTTIRTSIRARPPSTCSRRISIRSTRPT